MLRSRFELVHRGYVCITVLWCRTCSSGAHVAGWRLCPWWRPWRGTFHERHWVARILATSFEMRFQPPPTNASNSAGDGLLYLPGLSLATPQYSCRIKWQAIYNTSVKVDCTSQPPPLFLRPECLAVSQCPPFLLWWNLLFFYYSLWPLPRFVCFHQQIPSEKTIKVTSLHSVVSRWMNNHLTFLTRFWVVGLIWGSRGDCREKKANFFAVVTPREKLLQFVFAMFLR